MRWYPRSKIHNTTVTDAKIDYIGSITIDSTLVRKAGFDKGEKVQVWDVTSGERPETYITPGEENSGIICMNGAAARKIKKGHKVIIAGFELSDKKITPKIVSVNENNRFVKYLNQG